MTYINSPRNNKRSSMQAESVRVPFCKREQNSCVWDSAVSQMQAISSASGRRYADLMPRRGAMDFVPSTFSALGRGEVEKYDTLF